MAEVTKHPDNENITNVGDNFRIEPGPAIIDVVATEELLDNSKTAEHYHAPIEDENGGVKYAKDRLGNPIIIGNEVSLLDWGGSETEGKRVYYIYKKTPVDYEHEFLKGGERNPYYVPPEAREKETDDRTHYDYIWAEVATRATEEAAIDYCQRSGAE
jgi:hypothetical protein